VLLISLFLSPSLSLALLGLCIPICSEVISLKPVSLFVCEQEPCLLTAGSDIVFCGFNLFVPFSCATSFKLLGCNKLARLFSVFLHCGIALPSIH
jgi:hypothetical protein